MFKDELGLDWEINDYLGWANNVDVLKDGLGLGWKIDDYLGLANNGAVFKDELGCKLIWNGCIK